MQKSYFASGRLAPFAVAAQGEVVGTHDGVRATLHLGALDDDVVYYHEFGHEILFTRTTDGALLAMLWGAIDRPADLPQDRLAALIITAQTLMKRCQFAHEVFATYYGLKMVEPPASIAAMSRLPAEYRRYFDTAASVLDPHFKGTFAQVRVALTLSCKAFESRFGLRFVERPWTAWKSMRRDEQPNRRLETLLGHLATGGAAELRREMSAWAEESCAATGSPAWDVDDDAGWNAHEEEAAKLDVFLDKKIATWIDERQLLPSLSRDERAAVYARLRGFAAECGINMQVVDTSGPAGAETPPGLTPVLAHFHQNQVARAHALKQAASYVANQPLGAHFDRVTKVELMRDAAYQQAEELHVVGPDPAHPGAPWTVVRFGPHGARGNIRLNGRSAHGVHASGDAVVAWLNELVRGGARAGKGPLPEPIVVPFGSQARLGPRLYSVGDEDEPGKLSGAHYSRMAMYVVDNWISFVQHAASCGRVVLTEIEVDVGGYGASPQPLVLKIALCQGLPARCYFRAFGRNAGASVDLLALDWRSNDAIQDLPTEQAEEQAGLDLDFISGAMNGILAFWSLF